MPALEFGLKQALERPFPGLRSFEPPDSCLFFGRSSHTEQLLERLAKQRFLAVVGTSGSGKSSLVRAGLLPALHRGHLAGASSKWRIAVMNPGETPLDKLAKALADIGIDQSPALRRKLGRTSFGLTKVLGDGGLESGECLLLVVDQFEELFRFRQAVAAAESEAGLFVQSLVEATEQPDVPIYVVLTMRSDFMGDCAKFPELLRALNQSHYLIPQLSREQTREAIEGPLRLARVGIAPLLVQKLLNDADNESAQLPVLQHTLMRMFQIWKEDTGRGAIDFQHYEEAGQLAGALDKHASTIYADLPSDAHRRLAQSVFRSLTTIQDGRAVRRPTRLARIYAVLGAVGQSVIQERARVVIQRFAATDTAFLRYAEGHNLDSKTVIDISHECLIHKWLDLHTWVEDEARSSECYRYVNRDAALYLRGKASLWRDPQLSEAWQYVKSGEWNSEWAKGNHRHGSASFQQSVQFLNRSLEAREEERIRDELWRNMELDSARKLAAANARAKRWFGSAAALLLLLLIGTIGAWILIARTNSEKRTMEEQFLEEQRRTATLVGQADEKDRQVRGLMLQYEQLKAAGGSNLEEIERLNQQIAELSSEAQRYRAEAEASRQLEGARPQPDTQASNLVADLRRQLEQARQERDDALRSDQQNAEVIKGLGRELETARGERDILQERLKRSAGTSVAEILEVIDAQTGSQVSSESAGRIESDSGESPLSRTAITAGETIETGPTNAHVRGDGGRRQFVLFADTRLGFVDAQRVTLSRGAAYVKCTNPLEISIRGQAKVNITAGEVYIEATGINPLAYVLQGTATLEGRLDALLLTESQLARAGVDGYIRLVSLTPSERSEISSRLMVAQRITR